MAFKKDSSNVTLTTEPLGSLADCNCGCQLLGDTGTDGGLGWWVGELTAWPGLVGAFQGGRVSGILPICFL